MTHRPKDPQAETSPAAVNPGYAAFQIAKAFKTREEHEDGATRQRAEKKIAQWEGVLRNILEGSVGYGSRTPFEGIPGWATLEVVTGGFATGELLAGGPLQEHEKTLLGDLPGAAEGEERQTLNAYFLTDEGLASLSDRLSSGCYDVAVPEEGALLVVAWLVENGHARDARELLEQLAPYFPRLRFYPIPLEKPRRFGSRVHLQDVGETLKSLRGIRPNERVAAQKEAVGIWAPLHDRVVGLFLETVEDGWPCQSYPDGWSDRALALLGEYAELRKEHVLCGKPERPGGHPAQLRELLGRCARQPKALTGREVGRVRMILNRFLEKRGAPEAPTCVETRRRQAADVASPAHHEIVKVVAARLERYPKKDGVDDVGPVQESVTQEEAARTGVPEGVSVPPSIRRKVERCLNETVETLVERGLITSGETLARVLPQMTSGLRAAGITEATLRQLYAAIYRAFRRRRSLLLLNLEKQVRIEELPWVASIDRFRSESLSSRELAKQTLEEVTILTLKSFPHVILPNKLLQELRALVKGAQLAIPLVDELAADIFMGQFSEKFVESARRAADLLDGSLYTTYFDIDYREVRGLRNWKKGSPDDLAELCSLRAGVPLGTWDPASNGMIIEQQQILTTQNLAALFTGLDLATALHGELDEMARQCFRWICRRQQVKIGNSHDGLIVLKNTAYAWRQMIFFLALLSERDVADFLGWAEEHLSAQGEGFRKRFRPALRGLRLAAEGSSIDDDSTEARRFLGWSNTKHWLMPVL